MRTRPVSTVDFERCYLAAFVLAVINTLLFRSTTQDTIGASAAAETYGNWFVPVSTAIGFAVTSTLWYFIARKVSAVAKWTAVVLLVFGVIGIVFASFIKHLSRRDQWHHRHRYDRAAGDCDHFPVQARCPTLVRQNRGYCGLTRLDSTKLSLTKLGLTKLGLTGLAVVGLALGLPGVAHAQAYRCAVPVAIPSPRADLPSANQPRRVLPIGGYTLAITWAPEYCRAHARDPAARFQCGTGNRFGFTLHGLWPDGVGKDWPQYCAATVLVPRAVLRSAICATPSAQLIQHEWAKHGTCMRTGPAGYFRTSTGLFARLRYPDMDTLSRRPLTAGGFVDALAAANPGLPASAIRVTATKRGWLDEVWLCLDRSYSYERCKPGSGGIPASAVVKIWRGRR